MNPAPEKKGALAGAPLSTSHNTLRTILGPLLTTRNNGA